MINRPGPLQGNQEVEMAQGYFVVDAVDHERYFVVNAVEHENEVGALRAENERLRAKLQEAREALQELRISLHSQWRRPEECWEISLIDDALSRTRTER
jgi:hypothetical protein